MKPTPGALLGARKLVVSALVLLLGACAPAVYPLDDTARRDIVHDPGDPPRGIILALHGFNDYRRAFDDFAAFAAKHGYRVEAFDQQGFGANRNRGLWPGNEALAADVRHRLAAIRRASPEVPLYVLGESMGAAVAVLALAEAADLADGLIMAAPAVWGGASFNPFYRVVLFATANLLPRRLVTGRGLDVRASDNDAALIALGRDPMVIKETRLDAVAGLVRLMDAAVARAPELDLRVLLLAGEHDEVIPPEAVDVFAARIAAQECLFVRYAEGWHLLLRDLQRQRVWSDIIGWLAGEPVVEAQPCKGVTGQKPSAIVSG